MGEYAAALRLGRKCYQEALAKGEYPYLPALDDILAFADVVSQESLGVVDIPLDKIVGTKTKERTSAFAANFMPLLPEKSEFGAKWNHLYKYQIEEGIQEAVVVYEYMNRFYVQEGNKRVSVMKYLKAYSILGSVTRLIPRRSDEPENRLYYEFLDFYRVSRNFDLTFSKEGSYAHLLELMGKKPGQEWSEEERLFLRSAFNRFVKAFRLAGGDKLALGASDAFLVYVGIWGYHEVEGQTEKQMYAGLMKMWQEIELAARGGAVRLVETPGEADALAGKPNLIDWLLPSGLLGGGKTRIGFLYRRTAETSAWSYLHELGRLYLQQALGDKVETLVFDGADDETAMADRLDQAAAAGCRLVFTTSSDMVNESVRAALRHPQVHIYNCSVRMSYSSICTYYARMYEAKFLMGAIAAAMARGGELGYIATYPIYGELASVNAFALGARMIDPYSIVRLDWSGLEGGGAEERLREAGVGIVCGRDTITPNRPTRAYGLYRTEAGEICNLAAPVWHWGKFYEQLVRGCWRGNAQMEGVRGNKAVNYWWGMSAEVIDVICSESLPYGTHRLIEFLRRSIRGGSFSPFSGPLYAQDGSLQCREGESLKPEEIITMNWLAHNVGGRVPEAGELTARGRELVRLQGVAIEENVL